jgi:hypothetical protein
MPHHDGVDNEAILESELILAQLANAFTSVNAYIAGSRLQIASQNFHESGFARTVCAYQAVAVAVAEFNGDIFEQGLGPELHGNVGCGDQNFFLKKDLEKPFILYVSQVKFRIHLRGARQFPGRQYLQRAPAIDHYQPGRFRVGLLAHCNLIDSR